MRTSPGGGGERNWRKKKGKYIQLQGLDAEGSASRADWRGKCTSKERILASLLLLLLLLFDA